VGQVRAVDQPLRSQHLLRDQGYCAEGKNERFGVIQFAICSDVSPEFKAAVARVPEREWGRLFRTDADGTRWETPQEWAEVCFVPTDAARKKNGPTYRYLAIREPPENLLPVKDRGLYRTSPGSPRQPRLTFVADRRVLAGRLGKPRSLLLPPKSQVKCYPPNPGGGFWDLSLLEE